MTGFNSPHQKNNVDLNDPGGPILNIKSWWVGGGERSYPLCGHSQLMLRLIWTVTIYFKLFVSVQDGKVYFPTLEAKKAKAENIILPLITRVPPQGSPRHWPTPVKVSSLDIILYFRHRWLCIQATHSSQY